MPSTRAHPTAPDAACGVTGGAKAAGEPSAPGGFLRSGWQGVGSAIVMVCSMVLASGMAAPSSTPAEFAPAVSAAATAAAPLGLTLASAGEPTGLAGARYGLGVVPVPPPPTERVGMAVSACPEVRAVVLGEIDESSFVVVGDKVLHRGQALSWGGSQLVVQDLAAKQVTFVRGDVAVRCALPKLSMR